MGEAPRSINSIRALLALFVVTQHQPDRLILKLFAPVCFSTRFSEWPADTRLTTQIPTGPFEGGVLKFIIGPRCTCQQYEKLRVGGIRIFLYKLLEGLPHKPGRVGHFVVHLVVPPLEDRLNRDDARPSRLATSL
jgi:hypothetical protein